MKKYLKYLIVSVLTFVFGIVNVNAETITIDGLIDGLTADSNGIYTLADGTQLIYDNGPNHNLRFIGANPNNWVKFGDESPRWRIIGLMADVDDGTGNKESRLKLIQTKDLGKWSWKTSDYDVDSGNGINDWTSADLMKLLNPGYENNTDNLCQYGSECENGIYYQGLVNNSLWWNASSGRCYNYNSRQSGSCDFTSSTNKGLPAAAKDMIGDAVWYLGSQTTGSSGNSIPILLYLKARSMAGPPYTFNANQATTWTGKVGLWEPADYGFGTSGGNTMSRSQCQNLGIDWDKHGESSDCIYNNWLHLNSGDETWTMMPTLYSSSTVFYITNAWLSYTNATYARRVNPVVYLKSTVQITGGSGTEEDPYTLENIEKFNVTTSSDNNGSITASAEVNKGDNFEVEFTPSTGYEIDKVLVNNVDVTNNVTNSKLTINNITADTTVSVTYKMIRFDVTTTSGSNGTITGGATVNYNADYTITLTPNEGYEIDKVLVNNVDVTNDVTNSKLTINNITADTTVSVTYKMIRFDVTTTSGSNGTITGGVTVNYNADYTITLTPDTGYEIDTLSVNGVDVKSSVTDNKLVLKNILEDKVVKVTYKNSTYKFISGMDQEFDGDDLVFKTDGPLSIVGKVYVNDEELDSNNYTLKSGSTIITILKDYLTTLSDATYNLKITYTNGSEATTTFVVKASTPAAANTPATTNTQATVSSNPNTADTIMISVIIGIISLLGLAGAAIVLRKNSIKE